MAGLKDIGIKDIWPIAIYLIGLWGASIKVEYNNKIDMNERFYESDKVIEKNKTDIEKECTDLKYEIKGVKDQIQYLDNKIEDYGKDN